METNNDDSSDSDIEVIKTVLSSQQIAQNNVLAPRLEEELFNAKDQNRYFSFSERASKTLFEKIKRRFELGERASSALSYARISTVVDELQRHKGKSAWLLAAQNDDIAYSYLCFDRECDPNEECPNSKYHAIHRATRNNRPELIHLLHCSGAILGIKDYYENTPLHISVAHGLTSCTAILLENNVPVDDADYNGHTALHRLMLVRESVFRDEKELDLADEEIANKRMFLLKYLLNYGANPNMSDNCKTTPIMLAAIQSEISSEILAVILNNSQVKIDINQPGFQGNTALHMLFKFIDFPYTSTQNDFNDTVKKIELLIEAGADPNRRNLKGERAAHVAMVDTPREKQVGVISALWKLSGHAARMDLKSCVGLTPRDYFFSWGEHTQETLNYFKLMRDENYVKNAKAAKKPMMFDLSNGNCSHPIKVYNKLDSVLPPTFQYIRNIAENERNIEKSAQLALAMDQSTFDFLSCSCHRLESCLTVVANGRKPCKPCLMFSPLTFKPDHVAEGDFDNYIKRFAYNADKKVAVFAEYRNETAEYKAFNFPQLVESYKARVNDSTTETLDYIRECNSFYLCSVECQNRVTQRREDAHIVLQRINDECRLWMRSKRLDACFKTEQKFLILPAKSFHAGEFIFSYVGEIKYRDEIQNHKKGDYVDPRRFIPVDQDSTRLIDPRCAHNCSRYLIICDDDDEVSPNVEAIPVIVEINQIPKLAIFAKERIWKKEPLVMNFRLAKERMQRDWAEEMWKYNDKVREVFPLQVKEKDIRLVPKKSSLSKTPFSQNALQ